MILQAGKLYGEAIYSHCSNSQKAIISFGMTPVELVNDAEPYAREQIARAYARHHYNNEDDWQSIAPHIKKEVISEFTRGFCVGLMEAASKQGRMIA